MRRAFVLVLTLVAAASTVLAFSQAQSPRTATPAPPSTVAVVVLDPAHGGSDSGARGPGGILESEVVLDLVRAIRVALEAQGVRALLTRDGNQAPSFDDRSATINGLRDAVFISLHISSTGTVGTARAYFYSFPAEPPPAAPVSTAPRAAAPPQRSALLEWERAQQPYAELSQRLAELVQIQLAQHLNGSSEMPMTVPIRQLRTVAAPAIAIEISSIAADPQRLAEMRQPLGEAIARAIVAFRESLTGGAPASAPASAPAGGQ